MDIIVKYKVEKPFTDKYTKEEVKENDIIEISVERMKELNEKSAGRAIDIIVSEEEQEEKEEKEQENPEKKTEFSKEDLEKLTVNELKDLAEKNKIELTKATKKEIINEILSK